MDDDLYYEISSQLDAREILRYLNDLGIRNINGEVLKYFITDLKKLIKYDLQQKGENSARSHKSDIVGPERLHSASTFSSRIRSKVQGADIACDKTCQKRKPNIGLRNTHSAPNVHSQKKDENPSRRACSCVRLDKKPENLRDFPKSTASNSNLIKVPKQQIKRKTDPVNLYHYYTSLWAKYKPNVPGENNWADLRWNIRQKMVGSCPSQVTNKVSDKQSKPVAKKKT